MHKMFRCRQYLRCADAKRQGTECTMGRSMTVTTHDSCPWESEPLLWSDDMDDSLTRVVQSKVRESKGLQAEAMSGGNWSQYTSHFDIVLQGNALIPAVGFIDERRSVGESRAIVGWNVVIYCCQRTVRASHTSPSCSKTLKCLWRCHLNNHSQRQSRRRGIVK